MGIKILLFGVTADIVGNRELLLEYEDSNASNLLDRIIADHPRLADHKLLVSINQRYANSHEMIRDEDEIAIFTAVSGG